MRFAGESNPRFFPICAPARLAIPSIKKEVRRQMALLHNKILSVNNGFIQAHGYRRRYASPFLARKKARGFHRS